ncbi:MAG: hypothetical protein M1517_04500 [Deltaproteobacteria bacterium]|nr:hypothetical protein [Deltaproteobacteria bacterium]
MYRIKALVLSKHEPSAVFLKAIRKIGLTSRVAKDGDSALELVHKKAYKLICIETCGMGMDVLDTIDRISRVKSGSVIIAIIPRNQGVIYTKLMNNGIFEVLQKPLKQNVAEASLRRAVMVLKLYRGLTSGPDPGHGDGRGADHQLSDREIEDMGLDELIKKKLSILFSRQTHKKITNLYPLVMPIVEKAFMETALKLSNNNQLKASLLLGINRNTFKTKMIKLGIKKQ